jgi:hypothetical protein
LKRRVIAERYAQVIEGLYAEMSQEDGRLL